MYQPISTKVAWTTGRCLNLPSHINFPNRHGNIIRLMLHTHTIGCKIQILVCLKTNLIQSLRFCIKCYFLYIRLKKGRNIFFLLQFSLSWSFFTLISPQLGTRCYYSLFITPVRFCLKIVLFSWDKLTVWSCYLFLGHLTLEIKDKSSSARWRF